MMCYAALSSPLFRNKSCQDELYIIRLPSYVPTCLPPTSRSPLVQKPPSTRSCPRSSWQARSIEPAFPSEACSGTAPRGAALAVPIYHEFTDGSANLGYFILFVAVAVGITAFPVLCRILTELKLLDTTVGVVVLSAGVGNDGTSPAFI